MTHRERMLAALTGQPSDRLPWSPRVDVWYLANAARGTLPASLAGKDLVGIAQELGVACHILGSDGRRQPAVAEGRLRCLGLGNHPDAPFRIDLHGIDVARELTDDHEHVRIVTPSGEITAHLMQTDEMRRNGISALFAVKPPIAGVDDLEAVGDVFERVEVTATLDGYDALHARVGDQGLAICRGLAGSPMHMILQLCHPEQFFYLYADDRAALYRLAERMTPFFEAALDCAVASTAEAVLWGGNYHQDLTWPAFFEKEILPWMRHVSERLHGADKLLLSHCDGENDALTELIRRTGANAAESVCPAPMTRLSLAELRARWLPDVAVFGGIPSIVLLPDVFSDRQYRAYMDAAFSQLGSGERQILGVADMVPPDADLDRLTDVGRRVEAFGPVEVRG